MLDGLAKIKNKIKKSNSEPDALNLKLLVKFPWDFGILLSFSLFGDRLTSSENFLKNRIVSSPSKFKFGTDLKHWSLLMRYEGTGVWRGRRWNHSYSSSAPTFTVQYSFVCQKFRCLTSLSLKFGTISVRDYYTRESKDSDLEEKLCI